MDRPPRIFTLRTPTVLPLAGAAVASPKARLFVPIPGNMFAEVDQDLQEGDVVRSEIQICMTGHWEHPWYGAFDIFVKHLTQMKQNHRQRKGKLVVDYQHSSYSSDPDEAIAAGWATKGKPLRVDDFDLDGEVRKGMWLSVDWTAKAVERIRAREYRFTSPTIEWESKDRETGEDVGTLLDSVALTNQPWIEGMEAVSLTRPRVFYSVPAEEVSKPEGGGNEMDKEIREALGLAEDAVVTIEHLRKYVEMQDQDPVEGGGGGGGDPADPQPPVQARRLNPSRDPNAEPSVLATTLPGGIVVVDGMVQLSAEQYTVLQTNVSAGVAAAKSLKKMTAQKLVDDAITARKLLPAERESYLELAQSNLKMAEKLLAARVPLSDTLFAETGSGEAGEGGDDDKSLALAEFRANQGFYENLGITEKDAEEFAPLMK